jgi:hypothetical protein
MEPFGSEAEVRRAQVRGVLPRQGVLRLIEPFLHDHVRFELRQGGEVTRVKVRFERGELAEELAIGELQLRLVQLGVLFAAERDEVAEAVAGEAVPVLLMLGLVAEPRRVLIREVRGELPCQRVAPRAELGRDVLHDHGVRRVLGQWRLVLGRRGFAGESRERLRERPYFAHLDAEPGEVHGHIEAAQIDRGVLARHVGRVEEGHV